MTIELNRHVSLDELAKLVRRLKSEPARLFFSRTIALPKNHGLRHSHELDRVIRGESNSTGSKVSKERRVKIRALIFLPGA